MGQWWCPGQGGLRANKAVRILYGGAGALGTSPWPHRGWVSQGTTQLKPNVFLTSPPELEGQGACHGTPGPGNLLDLRHPETVSSGGPCAGSAPALQPCVPTPPGDRVPTLQTSSLLPPAEALCVPRPARPTVAGAAPCAPVWEWGVELSVGAFAHTNGCALPWAPAAAALPSSTSGPLIYATRGAVHSLVPRLAAALSPGGFPTVAFGKKGPFSGRQ